MGCSKFTKQSIHFSYFWALNPDYEIQKTNSFQFASFLQVQIEMEMQAENKHEVIFLKLKYNKVTKILHWK